MSKELEDEGGDWERRLLGRATTTGRGVAAGVDTGWGRRGRMGFVCAGFVGLCERVVDCCVGMWTGIWGWAFLCLALPARECFLLTAGRPVRGPYVAGDGWAAGEIKRCAAADPRPCRRTARAQNFSLRLNFS